MSIIKVNNLSKEFGEKESKIEVLRNINFEIKEKEFVSIMGPSGCGKSTLLYIVGGLDQPTNGTVHIQDKDINLMKDKNKSQLRRKDIGFVFQFYNLVQNLSVEENIMLPIIMDGKKAGNYKNELDEILDIVGLTEKRNSYPSKLSGGQQQRVAIARAVITNPKVLLADEPIGNLDSKSGTDIMQLFKNINEKKGITILQVTHSEHSAEYGSRIIQLMDGEITENIYL